MPSPHLTIGALARVTGCKVPTIRYFESIGLLPPPPRSVGNQRLYGPAHRRRLTFILHGRALGFSQAAIRELLALADDPEGSCEAADSVARRHIAEVEQRLAVLSALKSELERMVNACRGGRVADCRVLEVLADHAQCANGDHGRPR